MQRNVALKSALGIAIALGFLAFVLHYVGLDSLLAPWKDFGPGTALTALLLMFLSYLARAFRIFDYFRPDMDIPFAGCVKLTLYHNVLNNFLPMRTGEVSFPVLMSRYFAIPPGRSVPVLLWFRVLDLHALLCIGAGATTWHNVGALPGMLVLALGLPLPLVAIGLRNWATDRLDASGSGRLTRMGRALLEALPANARRARGTMLWTWLNWIIKLAALAWVLMQLSAVSMPSAVFSVILGDMTSVLPIHSAGGFGTYEAGIAAGLVPTGLALAEALEAAVNVHLFVLGASLIGGAVAVLIPRRSAASRT